MKNLFLILSFFFITFNLHSQVVPKHIDLPELGLSFDIPDGWTGQLEGEYLILGHQSIPGLMIIFQNNSPNTQALKETAMEGISEEGIALKPSSDFVIKGTNRVEGYYEGSFSAAPVKAYAIGLINGLGSGINILILTEKPLFNASHQREATKLAQSVRFYKVKDTPNTTFWKNKLVGKQLKYMYTNSSIDYTGGSVGLSEKTTIDLCRNGEFYYYSNTHSHIAVGNTAPDYSTSSSSGGSVLSNQNTTGNYKIYSLGQESYLELSFHSGTVVEYDLSNDAAGSTFLDETRYLVLGNERCN